MTILFELITIVLFVLVATLIFLKKDFQKRMFVAIVIAYIFFYDFLNFHLGEILGKELMVFKVGLEFFTLCAFVKVLLTKNIPKKSTLYIQLIALIAVWAVAVGLANGKNIKSLYLDFRSMILPVLLVIAIVQTRIQESVSLNFIMKCLAVLLLLNGIYSLIEFVTYTGEFQSYWRYRSLLKSKLGLNSEYNEGQLFYQIVRGDDIRSSGFIVSALAAGYLYGFLALWYFIYGYQLKSIPRKLTLYFYGVVFLGFSYLTQVRTSFVMVGLGLGIVLALRLFKSSAARKRLVYLIPVVLMVSLYAYLTSSIGFLKDASSQGRIIQYQTLFSNFSIIGNGLGSYPRAFDSFFIYTLLELGLAALVLYFLFYKMMTNESLNRISNLHAYCQFAIFLFICSFQHISGSLYYFLFLLVVSQNDIIKSKIRRKVNTPHSSELLHA